jgi:hypothetical protein
VRLLLPAAALLSLGLFAPRLTAQGALLARPVRSAGDRVLGEPSTPVEGGTVLPGSIATTSVVVPPAGIPAGAMLTYHITPYPGVRLFGDTVGRVAASSDSVALPVTYAVQRTRDAGMIAVARVVVEWDNGGRWVGELQARVQPRRSLRVSLSTDEPAAAGRTGATIRFAVANTGNTADTVRLKWDAGWDWRVQDAGVPLVIGPTRVYEGAAFVEWPRGAAGGDMRVVQLIVSGKASSATASLMVRVPYQSADALGLVTAATRVFVGSSTGGSALQSGPSIGVSSTGSLTPATTFALQFNRAPDAQYSRVFSEEMGSQRFRLEVRNGAFAGAVGSVLRPVSGLLGTVPQGDGVDLAWNGESLHSAVFAVRPTVTLFGNSNDAVVHASTDLRTRLGDIGITLTRESRSAVGMVDSASVEEAGLRFRSRDSSSYRLTAEVGAIRLSNVAVPATTGLAADLNYDATIGRSSLFARVHQVPAVLSTGEVLPSNVSLGGSVPVTGVLALIASGSQSSMTLLGSPTLRSDGVSAGVSVSEWPATVQLLANLRHADIGFGQTGRNTSRTLSGSLSLPLSAVMIDGYAEVGAQGIQDTINSTSLVRGGARWAGSRGWLWAGLSYSRNPGMQNDLHLETTGSAVIGPAEWQFGASLGGAQRQQISLMRTAELGPFNVQGYWTRASFAAPRQVNVVLGAEFQPVLIGRTAWRFSLGLQRLLDIPLPIRQSPVVEGVVFEDRNGNGRRDAGEPGIPGIVLTLGADHRQTKARGEFNFADANLRGQTLEVDAASLPAGYMIPASVHVASRGFVAIPVVRAGSITVVLHVENADGSLTEEISAPDGTYLSLTAPDGRTRDVVPAQGMATLDGLVAGSYTLAVHLPASLKGAAATRSYPVAVGPGERVRKDVGAPASRREVRFGPAAGAGAVPTTPPTND